MKFTRLLKMEHGFTLQELVVVLTVGPLLVSLGMTLFSFTNRLLHAWYRRSEVTTVVARVIDLISLDVMRSSRITEFSDSTVVLENGLGRDSRYRFGGSRVWRNGQAITPMDMRISVKLVRIQGDQAEGRSQGIRIRVQGKMKEILVVRETQAVTAHSAKERFQSALWR